jgi:hypothetical protein
MVRSVTLILLIFVFALPFPQASTLGKKPEAEHGKKSVHEAWDVLLHKYVDTNGQVDYKGFVSDSTALNAYLNILMKNVPGTSATGQEQLAYYINLYNAATIKMILNNYPVKSIRDIKDPWGREWIPVQGNLRSLGYLEHQVLRKMDEPRIHFAINCASNSCPKLANTAYTEALLESQLEEAARGFIRDTTRNRLGTERLQLSQLFRWYKKDFTKDGPLTAYIAKYAPIPVNPGAKISYLKYDWNLNAAD